jgi:hypothetical protein
MAGVNIHIRYLLLCLVTTCMYVFIVMGGKEQPYYQYSNAFFMAIFSSISFFIIHICTYGFNSRYFRSTVFCNVTDAPLVGFCWAMGNVFLLVSNPYTPALVQVVLNQSNIGVICVASYLFNSRRYAKAQIVACILALLGGLIPLFTTHGTNIVKNSPFPHFAWYAFYFCGTAPSALANTRIERILHRERSAHRERNIQSDVESNFSIPLFLSAANTYMIFCVLAFFWFPSLSAPTMFWQNFSSGLHSIFSFSDYGCLWAWCFAASIFASNLFTSQVINEKDATINTIICMISAGIAGVFMSIKVLFGPYYAPVHWSVWVSFVIVFLSALVYDGVFFKIKMMMFRKSDTYLVVDVEAARPCDIEEVEPYDEETANLLSSISHE